MLSRRDSHHKWAVRIASENPPPWFTCEAVLSEAFDLLGEQGVPALSALLSRRALLAGFSLDDNMEAVIAFLQKFTSVPMSLAYACLVRMSETMSDPLILTTDSDFHVHRRHSRQAIPIAFP